MTRRIIVFTALGCAPSAKWFPQGITGSAASVADGTVGGHRSLLVSYKDTAASPARVSFVNADSLDDTTYTHVAPVIPNSRTVAPIKTHAGAGTSGRVYSLTEARGDRIVFAINGSSVGL